MESPVIAAPVVAGPALYVLGLDGRLACLNPATGRVVSLRTLWSPPADRSDLMPFFGAPPAVSVREENGAVVRTLVIGGGDGSATATPATPPVLICIEDRDDVR
jgi:hypothetical protein